MTEIAILSASSFLALLTVLGFPSLVRADATSADQAQEEEILAGLDADEARQENDAMVKLRRLDRDALASFTPALVQRHCERGSDNLAYRHALELIGDRHIDLLASQLAYVSRDCQIQVLLILSNFGTRAEPVVDDVAAMLRPNDIGLWLTAADVLVKVGQPALPAIKKIIMENDADGLRAEAGMVALSKFHNLDTDIVNVVLAHLCHPDGAVRRAAARVLESQNNLTAESLEAIAKQLASEESEIDATMMASAMLTAGMRGCDALAAVIPQARAEARAGAAFGLAECPVEYLPSLVKLLDDPDVKVRIRAIEALNGQSLRLLPPPRRIWRKMNDAKLVQGLQERLARMLALDDVDVKIAAAYALGRGNTLPESVIRSLEGALEDGDPYLRWSAAAALSEAVDLDEQTIGRLTAHLDDSDQFVQGAVAIALAKHPEHGAVIPALIEFLQECAISDRVVRQELRDKAGTYFGARTPLCFRTHTSAGGWPWVLYERPAEVALSSIGARAIPSLVAVLDTDPDQRVVEAISNTILGMGRQAIPSLKACIPTTMEGTQVELRRILGMLEDRSQ